MAGMTWASVVCMGLALLLAQGTEARQSAPAATSQPWEGAPGVRRQVSDIMAAPAGTGSSAGTVVLVRRRAADPGGTPGPSAAPSKSLLSPPPAGSIAVQPLSPQTVGVNFLGAQSSDSPFIPPDSMGAVGPTQVLVAVNGRIRVFNRLGAVGSLDTDLTSFFSSILSSGDDTTDPRVRFDRLSGRWFVTCLSTTAPNRILIAVSGGSTISSSTDFTFFSFQHDLVGTTPNSDTGGFADYDTLGIDANALYIGANIFNSTGKTFLGATGYVVRKSSVLGAGPIVVTAFRQIATSSGAGLYTPQGVDNDDPTAT